MPTFRLKRLTIQNFRSIKNTTIEIKDGLYAIVGKNLDQPATFNGAGKSSSIFAFWWCLTGTALSGDIAADDVINIQIGKDCKVECIFDTDQGEVIITRYRKDKEFNNGLFLFINGQDLSCHKVADTQERINQMLNVSFEVLKSTIILTSDIKSRFSSLTPQGRVSLLESIRDYTIWEKVRNESNIDIKQFDAEINQNSAEINQLTGSENTYNDLVQKLRNQYIEEREKLQNNNLEADKNKIELEIAALNQQLSNINNNNEEQEIEQINGVLLQLSKDKEALIYDLSQKKEEVNQEYHKKVQELTQNINSKQITINNLQQDINNEQFNKRTMQQNISIIDKWFINDTCPTCNRKLDRTEVEINDKNNEKNQLLKNVDEIDKKIATINAQISTENEEKKKVEEFIGQQENARLEAISTLEKAHKNSIIEKETAISENNSKIQQLKTKIEQVNAQKQSINLQIADKNSKIALLIEQKRNNEAKIEEIKQEGIDYQNKIAEISIKKEELIKLNATIEKKKLYAKFFYEALGPKGNFRGVLLSKDIAFINESIKKYAKKFFIDTEIHLTTPSAEKHSIDIIFNADGIIKPIGSLSSGETKRLDLIIQMAIYDLVQSTSLFNINMCIFDEIESSLDPEGVRQLLEIIEERKDNIDTVWWITNNDMVSSNISQRIIAKKQNGFTKLEYL